jgi:hypothetical protein
VEGVIGAGMEAWKGKPFRLPMAHLATHVNSTIITQITYCTAIQGNTLGIIFLYALQR